MPLFQFFLLLVSLLQPLAADFQPIPYDSVEHEWMDRAVEQEFERFNTNGITKKMVETTWNACQAYNKIHTNPDFPHWGFHRFKIIDSQVQGPDGPIKNLLEVMVQYYPVPDVDFIYFNQDVVREDFFLKHRLPNNAPILVSAKNRNLDRVVLFTDWYFDIKSEGGWNGIIKTLTQNSTKWPWSEKIPKAVWRGALTDGDYNAKTWKSLPRGAAVFCSQIRPDLVDAGFVTGAPVNRSMLALFKQLKTASFLSVLDHTQFKYQLLIDGVTCTYPGSQWRLLSGCLTFKQSSDDIMWFYNELIPYTHYVPVEHNLSDLIDKVLWARENDELAQEIAENARAFALTHLMPEHILLYCYKVLVRYASLQLE